MSVVLMLRWIGLTEATTPTGRCIYAPVDRYGVPVAEEEWYAQLRDRWKPNRVKLLMIAESAPDDGGKISRRRFFYADRLGADNPFRGVVAAMYDISKDDLKRTGKQPLLKRLRDDGFFLIDLAPHPVNALSGAARNGPYFKLSPDASNVRRRSSPTAWSS